MKMKQVFFSAGMSLLIIACTAPRQATTTNQRVPARFDFSPPSRGQSGAANLTIALVKARFVDSKPEFLAPPFQDMATSMANDFEELLTAKGFTIRGPFGTRDEMVYNDKLNSNFALDVNIDLNVEQSNRKYRYDPGLGVLIDPSYKMSGEVIIKGSLVLTAMSPQYGEKIWKKSIPLNPASITYTGTIKWNGIPTLEEELKKDNEVYNLFAREMEKMYNQALDLSWRQIEAIEMKSVAEQSKKADNKGK